MLQFANGAAVGLLVAFALAELSTSARETVDSSSIPAPTAVRTVTATTNSVGPVDSTPTSSTNSVSATAANAAGTWWVCVTGDNLQVDGPRVRCHTPSVTIDVVPSCGVGHALVPNLAGNRDRCRNAMGGLLNYTCPVPHFSAVITSGQDICRRTTNGSLSPPTVKISY